MANQPVKSLVGVIVEGIGPDKVVAVVSAEGSRAALELALDTFPTRRLAAAALGLTPETLSKWLHTKTIDEWPVGYIRKLAQLTGIRREQIEDHSPQLPLPPESKDAATMSSKAQQRARKR